MKILWYSVAPWAPTGYGQQTAIFAPRLKDAGHDVTIAARFGLQGGRTEWNSLPVWPSDDALGDVVLNYYADLLGDDCQIITLFDVWPFLHHINDLRNLRRLACWVPVDHNPPTPSVLTFFRESGARPIAMSKFGKEALDAEGLDALYVPHGINTKTFAPFEQAQVREHLGVQADCFLVGMVANNNGNAPPRKAFPQAIAAFSELRKRHDDAVLWLHCEMTGRVNPGQPGVNLPAVLEQFQVPRESIIFTRSLQGSTLGAVKPSHLATIYSAMDVLLNPSYGEGFGIPIIEAQSCGVPVIVSDWTSMPELVGAGWKVGGEPWYDSNQHSLYLSPSVPQIVEALEQAYEKRGDIELRSAARDFAVQYDADRVMENYWKPALEQLDKPREAPPLLNREMRRRAKKVAA